MDYRKSIIMKKIKLETIAKTCPSMPKIQTKKLNLLAELQKELNKLVPIKEKTVMVPLKPTKQLYQYQTAKSARNTYKKL